MTDHLTQLYNRRGFFEKVNQQFSKYHDVQCTCSLLLLDLDQFKGINRVLSVIVQKAVPGIPCHSLKIGQGQEKWPKKVFIGNDNCI